MIAAGFTAGLVVLATDVASALLAPDLSFLP